MNENSITERLEEAAGALGMSVQEVCEKSSLNEEEVRDWCFCGVRVDMGMFEQIVKAFSISRVDLLRACVQSFEENDIRFVNQLAMYAYCFRRLTDIMDENEADCYWPGLRACEEGRTISFTGYGLIGSAIGISYQEIKNLKFNMYESTDEVIEVAFRTASTAMERLNNLSLKKMRTITKWIDDEPWFVNLAVMIWNVDVSTAEKYIDSDMFLSQLGILRHYIDVINCDIDYGTDLDIFIKYYVTGIPIYRLAYMYKIKTDEVVNAVGRTLNLLAMHWWVSPFLPIDVIEFNKLIIKETGDIDLLTQLKAIGISTKEMLYIRMKDKVNSKHLTFIRKESLDKLQVLLEKIADEAK